MKNNIFIMTLLSAFLPSLVSAQFKVTSNGTVGIALSNPITVADLSVGYNDGYNYSSSYAFGIRAERRSNQSFNIGIAGRSVASGDGKRAIGMQGIAGYGQNGWNFGVIGGLISTTANGTGIFGTTLNHTGVLINGRYAGYFDGEVYVNNQITATSFVSPSDIRLKQNVESVSKNTRAGSTLENVLNMNVIKYNYIDFRNCENSDTITTDCQDPSQDITADTHYGLSAQELQSIYPDLVKKGQDGYLGINYVELVPILIRSIQELKAELDEVKETKDGTFEARNTSALPDASLSSAKLFQNAPNPFSERTEVRFLLPDNTQDAFVYIFDMTGKMLRQIPVNSSMNSVIVNGYEFSPGIYLYSLAINGKEIDTKRMILSK